MDSQADDFVQQHMKEFNEQIAAMAQHHSQALLMVCAERLRQDVTQPQPPRWRDVLTAPSQWLKHRFASAHPQASEKVEMPNEDAVVVIDTTYTVVSSDPSPTEEVTPEQETRVWNK